MHENEYFQVRTIEAPVKLFQLDNYSVLQFCKILSYVKMSSVEETTSASYDYSCTKLLGVLFSNYELRFPRKVR